MEGLLAKGSVSKLLHRRRRVKLTTLAASFIVLFFLLQMATSRLGTTRAYTACSGSNTQFIFNVANSPENYISNNDSRLRACNEVLISGVTVVASGQNTFQRLRLVNGAKLTHAALEAADYESTTGSLTESGRNKKVDIVITNRLFVGDNSQIEADGKGYPGGTVTCSATNDGWDASASGNKDGAGPRGGYGFRNKDLNTRTCDILLPGFGGGSVKAVGGAPSGTLDITPKATAYVEQNSFYGSGGGAGNVVACYGSGDGGGTRPGGHGSGGGYGYQTPLNRNLALLGLHRAFAQHGRDEDEGKREAENGVNYSCSNGGAGGGIVKINAENAEIEISPDARISANGANGSYKSSEAQGVGVGYYTSYSGSGAGGYVEIKAKMLARALYPDKNLSASAYDGGDVGKNPDGFTRDPAVTNGNKGGSGVFDKSCFATGPSASQCANITVEGQRPEQYLYNVQAKGGDAYGSAGSGAGGHINFYYIQLVSSCQLHNNGRLEANEDNWAGIPSYCENQDVIIDGSNTVVDAGKVLVAQNTEARQVCTGSTGADIICDSKRKFSRLVVREGAVLTHRTIQHESDDLDSDEKYKKVDIEVSTNITLESGGKIDVSGKGFRGGYGWQATWDDGNHMLCQDPTQQSCGPNNEDKSECTRLGLCHYPYGPQPGGYSREDDNKQVVGGGGGSIGSGANGTGGTVAGVGGTPTAQYADRVALRVGSGGGSSYLHDYRDSHNYASWCGGGNGGGRVRLGAPKGWLMIRASNSYVSADGGDGYYIGGDNGDKSCFGGGGGGGSVYIEAKNFLLPTNNVKTPMVGTDPNAWITTENLAILGVYSGGAYFPGREYFIRANGGEPRGYNGARVTNLGGGGGGGWVHLKRIPNASIKVEKKVFPADNYANTGSYEKYSYTVNDVVYVWLTATNLVPESSAVIKDELFVGSTFGNTRSYSCALQRTCSEPTCPWGFDSTGGLATTIIEGDGGLDASEQAALDSPGTDVIDLRELSSGKIIWHWKGNSAATRPETRSLGYFCKLQETINN